METRLIPVQTAISDSSPEPKCHHSYNFLYKKNLFCNYNKKKKNKNKKQNKKTKQNKTKQKLQNYSD